MMDTKPGYKTTEFRLSLLAMLLGFMKAEGEVDACGRRASRCFPALAHDAVAARMDISKAWYALPLED